MRFFVTLPSAASRELFNNNRSGKYTTRLARALDLVGVWEVGLAEIMFPPKKIQLVEEGEFYIT